MKNLLLHITAFLFIGSPNAQTLTIPCTCQIWDVKNLDVTTYSDAAHTPIRHAQSDSAWKDANNRKQGAWCYYEIKTANGIEYATEYGKLYNWYAVNDRRGLAPAGYHIPSDKEWTTLEIALFKVAPEGDQVGGKMKEAGTMHWFPTNLGDRITGASATNISGFTALPGGYRTWNLIQNRPSFLNIQIQGFWWSSTEAPLGLDNPNNDRALARYLTNNKGGLYGGVQRNGYHKQGGYSVRCIKNCQ